MLRLIGWVGLGWALAAAACSTSQGPASLTGPLPGGSTSELVSPDGGTVTTLDGVTIVVPPGAVSTPTFFSVRPGMRLGPNGMSTFEVKMDGSSLSAATAVGQTYDLDADGATLAVPVTVTLPFDPTKIPAGMTSSDVAVYVGLTSSFASGTPAPTTLIDATHVSTQTSMLGAAFCPAVSTPEACGYSVFCTRPSCVNGVCDGG